MKPKILVFAGPNGSGKSTITSGWSTVGVYVNADDIKRHRGCSDLEAAQEAERIRESLIVGQRDFTFETVLSTERNIKLLEKANASGYNIESVFVLTANAEINVLRVKARVAHGGHDVPEDKIRSRYQRSLKLIKRLIELSDECVIVDNTIRPDIICRKDDAGVAVFPNRFWDEDAVSKLLL